MAGRSRAQYTPEFKEEAVRLVTNGEKSVVVARNLGMPEQTLNNWVRDFAKGILNKNTATASVTAEQMEISRLKAELSRTRMERDILKKAAAYFAKESL